MKTITTMIRQRYLIFVFLLAGQFMLTKGTNLRKSNNSANNDDVFTLDNVSFPRLKNYILWHNEVLTFMSTNPTGKYYHEPVFKFMVVKKERGGLADRLKFLPYFLWMAIRNDRILLLDGWEDTDCPLQEYLQPNLINWAIPDNMPPEILNSAIKLNKDNQEDFFNHDIDIWDFFNENDAKTIEIYGNHLTENGLGRLFREASDNEDRRIFQQIFRSMFRLSDPVQQMLHNTRKELGLLNRDYIGVHLRLRYPRLLQKNDNENRDFSDLAGFNEFTPELEEELMQLSNHALNCTKASFFQKNRISRKSPPIYVASDTVRALELLKQEHPEDEILFLSDDNSTERLHSGNMDAKYVKVSSCSAYYPAIIDLWMLAGARCIGFGTGGYGALATMMSDFDCWVLHQENSHLSTKDLPHFHDPDTGKLPQCTNS